MKEMYMKVKHKYAKVKEEFNSERRKWSEEMENIREKCRQVEVQKRKLEIDLKEEKRRVTNGSAEVPEKLMAEVEHFKSLLEESNGTITMLLEKNDALERRNSRLGMDLEAQMALEAKKRKMEEEKILELVQRIQVVEREKGEMEAEFCKMKEDNRHEAERNFNVNKALESEKKKAMEKINELVKRVGLLETVKEAEKRIMEDEGTKNVSELTHRVLVLEREKRELEVEVCRGRRERSAEINKILSEELKKFLKEKKVLEQIQRTEVLERGRKELETEVFRAKRERSEEIKKILNEKKVLEREKWELEVETREKDERIKVLERGKGRLAGKGKDIETNGCVAKSQEDVELPQRVHPAINDGILSAPTAHNQGEKYVRFPDSDVHKSYAVTEYIDLKNEEKMTGAYACKSKRPLTENLTRDENNLIAKRLRSSIKKS